MKFCTDLNILMSGIAKKSVCFYFVLIGFVLICQVDAMEIKDFFPAIEGNLTKITWEHAVNNKTHLTNALKSGVMMLEADVIYGQINGTGDKIPIMGHPPSDQSDLSLNEFLKMVATYNKDNNSTKKGIKLDFKSTEAFTNSVTIVKTQYNSIDYPIWINADIIKGPQNDGIPVDSNEFLKQASTFNKSVWSLGWTTTTPSPTTSYTDDHIKAMLEAIATNKIQQNVTFAVRAGIAAQSFDQMKALKTNVSDCTLTIWSSKDDKVDVAKLRDVIFEYGVRRVFVDVPEELYQRLNLGSGASRLQASLLAIMVALFFKWY